MQRQPITLRALLDGEHAFLGYITLGMLPTVLITSLALLIWGR